MAGENNVMHLDSDKAREICTKIFTGAGVKPDQAALVAENLIMADLRGVSSHGVSRMAAYSQRIADKMTNLSPKYHVVSETASTILIDADNGLGAPAGVYAMDKVIEKAKVTGMASCAMRHSTHYGIAAFYGMRALPHDMIGMAFTNAPPTMAPWGSITPLLGTNPLCYCIPAGARRPLVLDAATSVVARGKINLAEIEGRQIPDYWAMDEKGLPTTDPTEALKGCVLPFGIYKGSGISIIIDIFCALLSGASFGQHVGQLYGNSKTEQDIGHFFCAMDIKSFTDPSLFKSRVDQMIDEIKGSKKAEGTEEIYMPGEIEFNNEAYNREHGIEVGPGVMADLDMLCKKYGVDMNAADYLIP